MWKKCIVMLLCPLLFVSLVLAEVASSDDNNHRKIHQKEGKICKLQPIGQSHLFFQSKIHSYQKTSSNFAKIIPEFCCHLDIQYVLDAATSSGILKVKQKLGVTFNFDKQDVIDLTKISKMTMCRASEANSEKQSQILCFWSKKIIKGCSFISKLKEI